MIIVVVEVASVPVATVEVTFVAIVEVTSVPVPTMVLIPLVVVVIVVVLVAPALASAGIPVTILIFSFPPANFLTPKAPRSVMLVGAVQSVAGVGVGIGIEVDLRDGEGDVEEDVVVEGMRGIMIVSAGGPGKVSVIISCALELEVRVEPLFDDALAEYAVEVTITVVNIVAVETERGSVTK